MKNNYMINNSNPTIAILSNKEKYKLASIMFDYITPLDDYDDIPKELIYESLIPSNEIVENKFARPLIQNLKKTKEFHKYRLDEDFLVDEISKLLANQLIENSIQKIDRTKYIPIPVFNSSDNFKNFYKSKNNILTKKVEIELLNAPIISVENVDWQQIIDAKKDDDFKKKVRNFSLFINKNYKDRSTDFIQDSLTKQLEEYEQTLAKHGFSYARTAIKEIVGSKSIFGTLALTLMSSLFVTPAFAMVTSVMGAVVELGQVHLKVSEIEDEFSNHIQNSDIALLIELNKMIK